MKDYIFEGNCMIHSLKGVDIAKITEKTGDNEYIAEYKGIKYTAIFNFFTGYYYIDDKYGIIK